MEYHEQWATGKKYFDMAAYHAWKAQPVQQPLFAVLSASFDALPAILRNLQHFLDSIGNSSRISLDILSIADGSLSEACSKAAEISK